MFLITEHIENVEYIKEDSNDGNSNYFIEGIFMQSEKKNRNGRIYPKKTIAKKTLYLIFVNPRARLTRSLGNIGMA